jgi:two-component system cell cycle sensor histidine kinase/response regulator CckA
MNDKKINTFSKDTETSDFIIDRCMEEIIIVSPDGSVVFANNAAVLGLGYTRDELCSLRFDVIDTYMHFDSPEWVEEFFGRLKTRQEFEFETIHRKKNGDKKFKQIKAAHIGYSGVDCVCLYCLDISSRMKSELDILRSEERFRNIFEESFDMLFLVDQNGTIVEWNNTIEKISGVKKINAVDHNVWEIITKYINPPLENETNEDVINTLRKYAEIIEQLKKGTIADQLIEAAVRRPDGKIHYVQHAFFSVTNPRGSGHMLGNMLRDVTQQKSIEKNLKEREGLLSAMIEHIPFDLWVRDRSETFILQSGISIDTWGNLCGAPAGKPFPDAVIQWDRNSRRAYAGETVHEEVSFTIRGETRDFFQIIAPFYADSELKGILGINIDMTEKNRMEDEHLKMQKLESLGILAGGIAHDFRNILTAVLGNVSLSLMGMSSSSEIYRYLKNAENAILRAKDLTGRLLTFSKGGDPVKSYESLPEIIRDSASLVLSGSNIQCEYQIEGGIPHILVDRVQLGQVVQNIVINAIQAMPHGGNVQITAGTVDLHDDGILPLPEGHYATFSVSDNGHGIDEAHLKKIFDPYFTTKAHGTGLGLSVVYSVIKKHHGMITVDSNGSGTTFTVYLPAHEDPKDDEELPYRNLMRGHGNVLVIDDEEVIRMVTRDLLEKIGYDVDTAASVEEAIELFDTRLKHEQPYHAVIMDLTIPGSTGGQEGVKLFHTRYPGIKVIVSSGYSNDPVLARPGDYGFADVLIKPVDITDLARVVFRVVHE